MNTTVTLILAILGILVLILYLPILAYMMMIYPCYCFSKQRNNFIGKIGGICSKYFMHKTKMLPSHRLRMWIYRHVLRADLKKNVVIYFGVEIRSAEKLHIGGGSIVGDNSVLDARNGITIGKNVNLSSEVHIWTEHTEHPTCKW